MKDPAKEAGSFYFSFVTMLYKKLLTKEQALQKLKHYCGYQERCHSEVKQKLYDLGVWKKDHDEIIAALIEEGYLNEERFAIAFAGGKFRMKQWGRVKIKYELKQRQVSDYSIKKALKQIGEEEYLIIVRNLAGEKYASLKSEQYLARKKKTIDYLVQKGFENELVLAAIQSVIEKKSP
ncbi:MAG: regulatory protein RecX [Bacteroidota bacterium]|nr:regulatory protein RecX [Bacteroidota bacterium]